ncbi:MAG: hypothetical protein ACEY3D_06250 [Rickettsia sp.]|uniref:hypothetical protein n=1 Tax=Rickettsia sp. TaxID=789 RepID=UPI0039782F71
MSFPRRRESSTLKPFKLYLNKTLILNIFLKLDLSRFMLDSRLRGNDISEPHNKRSF